MSVLKAKKPFYCVVCYTTDPSCFSTPNNKSLCKKHMYIQRTDKIKKKINKPYFCVICGVSDTSLFYSYRKNKCRNHHNTKTPDPSEQKINPVSTSENDPKSGSSSESEEEEEEELSLQKPYTKTKISRRLVIIRTR